MDDLHQEPPRKKRKKRGKMRSRQQLRRRQTNAHRHFNSMSTTASVSRVPHLSSYAPSVLVAYMSSIRVWSIYPRAMIARSIFKTWSVGRLLWHPAILTRQGAIHTLTWSPPGAEAISPPFLHRYHFPLSFSGPLLLPNLCTKSLCSFLVTLEPILSPPVSIVRQRILDEFGYSGSNYSLLQVTNLQFCYQLLDWSPVRSVLYVHNSKRMLLEVCFYCFCNSRDDIIPP